MESQLKYLELKTGHVHNGPAWIAKVDFSKSGKTIYFNGRSLKGNGHGVCVDIETQELYWVSGIKKDGQDRHWAGNGKILIDRKIVNEYLASVGLNFLDTKKYTLIDVAATDKKKLNEVENS